MYLLCSLFKLFLIVFTMLTIQNLHDSTWSTREEGRTKYLDFFDELMDGDTSKVDLTIKTDNKDFMYAVNELRIFLKEQNEREKNYDEEEIELEEGVINYIVNLFAEAFVLLQLNNPLDITKLNLVVNSYIISDFYTVFTIQRFFYDRKRRII
jgi:hypothetical protein